MVAECYCGAYEGHGLHNADLIAHAPTDLDALVDEVERLRGEAERERAAVAAWLRKSPIEEGAESSPGAVLAIVLHTLAAAIESGEHREEDK